MSRHLWSNARPEREHARTGAAPKLGETPLGMRHAGPMLAVAALGLAAAAIACLAECASGANHSNGRQRGRRRAEQPFRFIKT